MARNPKPAARALIEMPSTAVEVVFNDMQFLNASGFPDQDFMTYDIAWKFNGFAGADGGTVTFARNATQQQKANAVRDKINEVLEVLEPGHQGLNNANIQIRSMPV